MGPILKVCQRPRGSVASFSNWGGEHSEGHSEQLSRRGQRSAFCAKVSSREGSHLQLLTSGWFWASLPAWFTICALVKFSLCVGILKPMIEQHPSTSPRQDGSRFMRPIKIPTDKGSWRSFWQGAPKIHLAWFHDVFHDVPWGCGEHF